MNIFIAILLLTTNLSLYAAEYRHEAESNDPHAMMFDLGVFRKAQRAYYTDRMCHYIRDRYPEIPISAIRYGEFTAEERDDIEDALDVLIVGEKDNYVLSTYDNFTQVPLTSFDELTAIQRFMVELAVKRKLMGGDSDKEFERKILEHVRAGFTAQELVEMKRDYEEIHPIAEQTRRFWYRRLIHEILSARPEPGV